MHSLDLVVFDLEWNHDFKSNGFDFYGKAETFHGEIVQIGAVRLKDMEQFSLVLKPSFFPLLNKRVAKLTNLSQEMLDNSAEAQLGLQKFLDWCGEDALLASWGAQDSIVLLQNLFLNGMDEAFHGEFFNLQAMFAAEFSLEKAEPALAEAVEFFKITEEFPYHDALADAVYAAEICRCLDWENGVIKARSSTCDLLEYAKQWESGMELSLFRGLISAESWRLEPKLQKICCADCGAETVPADFWQKSSDNRAWYALWDCPCCGEKTLIRVKTQQEGRLWSFVRGVLLADEGMKIEWKRRCAIELRRRKRRKSPPEAEFAQVLKRKER